MAKRVHFGDNDRDEVAPRNNHKRPCVQVEGDILQRLEPQATISRGATVLVQMKSVSPSPNKNCQERGAGPESVLGKPRVLHSAKKKSDDDDDDESLDSNDGHGSGSETQDMVLAEENNPNTTEITKEAKQEEGIDVLAKLLAADEWQSDRPRSVLEAVNQVRLLLQAQPEEYCEKLALYGGHFVLLNALNKWSDHRKLQGKLLLCLTWFVGEYLTYSTPSSPGRSILSSIGMPMGGLERIILAMNKFPDSAKIQYHGILLVGFLCRDAIDPMGATVEQFVRLQGVSLVVQAMRDKFPHKKNLQKYGCRLLKELVCNCDKGYEDASVMKREALAAVALAVDNFPDSVQIHNYAASFMRAVMRPRQDVEETEDETDTEDENESGDESE